MIVLQGKLVSYVEACRNLKRLMGNLEEARGALEEANEKVWELEGKVVTLGVEINNIIEQIRAADITEMLPTGLLHSGFKLTYVEMNLEDTEGFWGKLTGRKSRLTILEDQQGNAVREWASPPSLTALLEI